MGSAAEQAVIFLLAAHTFRLLCAHPPVSGPPGLPVLHSPLHHSSKGPSKATVSLDLSAAGRDADLNSAIVAAPTFSNLAKLTQAPSTPVGGPAAAVLTPKTEKPDHAIQAGGSGMGSGGSERKSKRKAAIVEEVAPLATVVAAAAPAPQRTAPVASDSSSKLEEVRGAHRV